MNGDLRVSSQLVIPAAELQWRFSRSSGPGGQGVNTTDSRVELSWDLANSAVLAPVLKSRATERLANRLVDGVITVAASESRAQLQNRRLAANRLALLLIAAIAPPQAPRRATKPSKSSVERRLVAKKRRGEIKKHRRGDFS